MRLSVVITNFDYARYLGEAIDSALGLQWPDVEVVVVDNGSTDDSLAVMARYGSRIVGAAVDHGVQRRAANHGFALSTGDVVLFLDADDALPPDLPVRLAAAMGPETSKVQFQMQRVNSRGARLGKPFPEFRPAPTPKQVRHWLVSTSAYPTPPGSGNAYARWFLERILPAGPDAGDFLDSVCLATAPLLGEVASLPGVLVAYRRHDDNDSDLMGGAERFGREVLRARQRWLFALRAAGLPEDEGPLFRSRELLQFRVAAARTTTGPEAGPVAGENGLPGDSGARRLGDALRSPAWPGPEGLVFRFGVALWCLAVARGPAVCVPWLLRQRYAPSRRRGDAPSTGAARAWADHWSASPW